MLVKINKVSNPHLWYSDLIGHYFVVYVYKDKPYLWVTWFMYIVPEDIEEVLYEEELPQITIASFINGEA